MDNRQQAPAHIARVGLLFGIGSRLAGLVDDIAAMPDPKRIDGEQVTDAELAQVGTTPPFHPAPVTIGREIVGFSCAAFVPSCATFKRTFRHLSAKQGKVSI